MDFFYTYGSPSVTVPAGASSLNIQGVPSLGEVTATLVDGHQLVIGFKNSPHTLTLPLPNGLSGAFGSLLEEVTINGISSNSDVSNVALGSFLKFVGVQSSPGPDGHLAYRFDFSGTPTPFTADTSPSIAAQYFAAVVDNAEIYPSAPGNVKLNARGENNTLYGGSGHDILQVSPHYGTMLTGGEVYGNNGNDRLYVNGTNNLADGGNGDDLLRVIGSLSLLSGGNGNDQLYIQGNANAALGGSGNDRVYVQGNNNLAEGWSGNDGFRVSGNQNTLNGGAGGDSFRVHGNGNLLLTGTGNDQVTLTGNGNRLDLTGGGNDTLNIQGTGNAVRFDGAANGNSTLRALEANPSATTRSTVLDVGNVSGVAFFRQGEHLIVGTATNQVRVSSQFNTRAVRGVGEVTATTSTGDLVTLSAAQLNTITQQMATYAKSQGLVLNSISDVLHNADLMTLVAGAWS